MGRNKKQPVENVIPLVPLRVEKEFLVFPIHTFTGRGKGDKYHEIVLKGIDQNGNEFLWEVIPSARYGTPGELAYKIDRLVIDRKLDEAGAVKPKTLPIGSLRDIAKSLNCKDSGGRVLTKGTLEEEYHKYEPKPASRIRQRKLEPVTDRKTGRNNY